MSAVRDEAHLVLDTCTSTTPIRLVAWAVGATQEAHALSVWQIIRGTCNHNTGGVTYANGRALNFSAIGVMVRVRIGGMPIASFAWNDVHAILRPDVLGEQLLADVQAALELRRQRTPRFEPWRPVDWWQSPGYRKAMRLWFEIEDHCRALGQRAWTVARPTVDEPCDLLELLAAGGGS